MGLLHFDPQGVVESLDLDQIPFSLLLCLPIESLRQPLQLRRQMVHLPLKLHPLPLDLVSIVLQQPFGVIQLVHDILSLDVLGVQGVVQSVSICSHCTHLRLDLLIDVLGVPLCLL